MRTRPGRISHSLLRQAWPSAINPQILCIAGHRLKRTCPVSFGGLSISAHTGHPIPSQLTPRHGSRQLLGPGTTSLHNSNTAASHRLKYQALSVLSTDQCLPSYIWKRPTVPAGNFRCAIGVKYGVHNYIPLLLLENSGWDGCREVPGPRISARFGRGWPGSAAIEAYAILTYVNPSPHPCSPSKCCKWWEWVLLQWWMMPQDLGMPAQAASPAQPNPNLT
jgi:hypothetical protein